jgi:hypothetical protein
MTIGDLDPRLLWHSLRGWYLPEDTEPDRAAHLRAAERLRASHDDLLAAAKKVMSRMPVPRGARRPEFDELEDAIVEAEKE